VTPQLNHTLVQVHDAEATSSFLSEVLGLPPAFRYGPFLCVETDNAVSLDVIEFDADVAIDTQHYAFLVTDEEFDAIFARLLERSVEHYADPGCSRPGEVNDHDGGRGTYFHEPGGHLLEILTVPYGGWPTR
jgi:catechol 2,3-dioxygenase-like lactoylglutathione lyase family enzyme